MKIKTKKSRREDEDDEPKKKKSKLYSSEKKSKKRPREDEEDEEDDEEEEDEEDEPKSKKRHREEEEDDEDSDDDSWMIRDKDEQKKVKRTHEAEMRRNSDRPPELWIKDGESRMIQFLSNEPVAMLFRYTVPQGGNRFEKITAPGPGKKDLMKRGGLRASLLAYYPVVDKTGYVDRNGKRFKNVLRLLVATGKQEKQIEKMREKKGDLTRIEIDYSRSGTSTDTTYTFFPEGKIKPHPETNKHLKLVKQKFKGWYRPPTLEEQRVLLNGASKADNDDD
jgi:hypothetical protein